MRAYYNEIDPFAAATLRELICAGVVAPGDVDERSIEIVQPGDLAGYAQCHFFAGFGVWSYALRLGGWRDDRPVWTGSCPCQPFSDAGKGEGFDDARHLWPHFFRLIRACGPRIAREHGAHVVFGEQVASLAGLAWLDVVSTDLENAGYAVGTVDTCAAGVGAPHIRQRSYWVADHNDNRCPIVSPPRLHDRGESGNDAAGRGASGVLGFADFAGLEGYAGNVNGRDESRWLNSDSPRPTPETSAAGALADRAGERWPEVEGRIGQPDGRPTKESDRLRDAGGRAHADAGGFGIDGPASGDRRATGVAHAEFGEPTRGFWGGAEWIACTDGKARPIEPGTFPLAHGTAARVGRLRGYGNAIVAEQAKAFIEAYLDVRGG